MFPGGRRLPAMNAKGLFESPPGFPRKKNEFFTAVFVADGRKISDTFIAPKNSAKRR